MSDKQENQNQSEKEVRLEDLAVGQDYYDMEVDDNWHDQQIEDAYEIANEERAFGGLPEYGPGMSENEIEKMIDDATKDDRLMLVHIDKIYKDTFDGQIKIDTQSRFGGMLAADFLEKINTGKAIRLTGHDKDEIYYIKHNVSILAVAKDMGFTPVKEVDYYSLKGHDSVYIYPDTNSYCQSSVHQGGSPIAFVMNFGGCNLEDAIKKLKEQYVVNHLDSLPKEDPKPVQPQPDKMEFVLPEKVAGKYSHAFAYLTKTRGLDAAIVTQCIKNGLIYEDTKHNVVFVSKDETGKPAFATRHTSLTGSSFKRDVAGSRQDIGWMAGSPAAEKLYICEAPIDALSIMSLRKQQGLPTERASYLATCGTGKSAALFTRLKEYPKINEVVLANDSDTAGKEANRKILERLRKEYPKVTVKLLKPQKGKDINECLCVGSPKTHNRGLEVEK